MSPTAITDISDIRNNPLFLTTVADRLWQTWSRHRGHDFQFVIDKLRYIAASEIEFTLVAHREEKFLGTISLLLNDMTERPQFSPWIAALWVEPDRRQNRIGNRLLTEAEAIAFERGNTEIYLKCRAELRGYYSALGWQEIDAAVGVDRSFVFSKRRV